MKDNASDLKVGSCNTLSRTSRRSLKSTIAAYWLLLHGYLCVAISVKFFNCFGSDNHWLPPRRGVRDDESFSFRESVATVTVNAGVLFSFFFLPILANLKSGYAWLANVRRWLCAVVARHARTSARHLLGFVNCCAVPRSHARAGKFLGNFNSGHEKLRFPRKLRS